MLAGERWLGRGRGRAPVPAARALGRAPPGGPAAVTCSRTSGPGTARLCALEPGESVWTRRAARRRLLAPREGRRAVLVGGGVGDRAAGDPQDQLSAPSDGAARLPRAPSTPPARRSSRRARGHRRRQRRAPRPCHAAARATSSPRIRRRCVYACGPAADARERARAVRQRGIACQLALEAPMACGFGACYGCVVPRRGGGYLRVCVDGPVVDAARARARRRARRVRPHERRVLRAAARASGHQRLGHVRRDRGRAGSSGEGLLSDFPFSAYVSKTITLEPRAGNPPPRLWEAAGGHDQLDRAPEQGPRGLPARGPARARGSPCSATDGRPGPADHQRDGLERRGVRAPARTPATERAEIAAIELNVSCPNVKTGLDIGADPAQLREVRRARVRPCTGKAADRQADAEHRRRARCAPRPPRQAGADAVSLINTLRAMALAPAEGPARAPWLGGRHRRALRPRDPPRRARPGRRGRPPASRSRSSAWAACRAHGTRASCSTSGATLVAVGTESFRDPAAGRDRASWPASRCPLSAVAS